MKQGRPKKTEVVVTISVRGGINYRHAVRAAAARNGMQVGDFVRQALDAHYGPAIQTELNFLAQRGK